MEAEDGPQAEATKRTIWQLPEFRAYLGSTAFAGVAVAMQVLLVNWLLIGILLLPADRVGVLQALMGLPGIALMLWGGASADRLDPRTLLIRVYAYAPIIPVSLILAEELRWLSIGAVVFYGLGMGVVASYSSPAQQAILNRAAALPCNRA